MNRYQLIHELLEKLEAYDATMLDKNQLNISGFSAYLATNDIKHFESSNINAGDKNSAERDARLALEETPSSLDNTISQIIVFLYRYAKQYIKKALKDSEIKTMDEFSYLATLLNFNQLSKIELINKSVQEKTTGMETIKRLLKNNLIEQLDNPNDQRSQLIQLTEKGRGVLYGVFGNMNLVGQIVTGNLTNLEKIQLAYLLKKLDVYHNDIFHNKREEPLGQLVYKAL
jgi:MarR family transcriptional regulator, lower aerobic nicotinate degradation pathway regulator